VALDSPFEIKLTKAPNQVLDTYMQEDDQNINFEKKTDFHKKNDKKYNENDEKKEVIRSYYQNKYIKFPFIVIDILDGQVRSFVLC